MKTKRNTLIVLCALAFIAFTLYSFNINTASKRFQYLTVFTEHYDLDKVYISIDGKEYKKLDFQKQIKGPWDLNPLINLIHQYENEGWELVQLDNNIYTSFYMRKEIE
jgi:hypothetical protein